MEKIILISILYVGLTAKVNCQTDNTHIKSVLKVVETFLEAIFPYPLPVASFVEDLDLSSEKTYKALSTASIKVLESFFPFKPMPKLPQDTWWGEGDETSNPDSSIRPFAVNFSDDMVKDLRARLVRRSNITSLNSANNTYGTNSDLLNTIIDYWANGYDFESRAKKLNRHSQFVTKIQGLDIHFLHITQPKCDKNVVPIILMHGSPVTAFEFSYVIDFLSIPRKDSDFLLEIVAPDIPGYGYSQRTNKQGLNAYEVAIIMKNLMSRLGHEKFYVHGGDVGFVVSEALAQMYPKDILGYHTNLPVSLMPKTLVKYVLGQLFPPAVVDPQYTNRMYPLVNYLEFLIDNSGYFHQYVTKPDTVGIGLDESPIALAGWLLTFFIIGGEGRENNKYIADGNIHKNYDIDDLLDSFTIYWVQQCSTTSARFYSEFTNVKVPVNYFLLTSTVEVPYAALKFKDEIVYMPDDFLKDQFPNLVQSTTLDFGGHFAGFMNPDVLAESIRTALPKMREFNKQKKSQTPVNYKPTTRVQNDQILSMDVLPEANFAPTFRI